MRHADARAEFATQLADAKAATEKRFTAMQAECEQRLVAQQVAHDKAITELRTAHADVQTKNAELDDVVVDLGERLEALTQTHKRWALRGGSRLVFARSRAPAAKP